MKDSFGRTIDYLRISLTDRCNLRCVYCMPVERLPFISSTNLLTAEELEKVARAAVAVGFRKIRLTGGEPTLHRDIVDIVRRLAAIEGVDELVMTTNGYRLPYLAESLVQAGLKRVNIHIDSLSNDTLPHTMWLGNLDKTWAGIRAAEAAGLTPLKFNVVVVRGYNYETVVNLARLTLEKSWQIRYIELMPFAGATGIQLDHYVSSDEVKQRIEAELGPLFPVNSGRLEGETRAYRLAGSVGTVGFISPVSNPYCNYCNRMRLTADGHLRMCLLDDKEINLKHVLRGNGSHQDLMALLVYAIQAKPAGHNLEQNIYPETRTMSQIGG
jgi:cyclic pyranopterin phosphate synthase